MERSIEKNGATTHQGRNDAAAARQQGKGDDHRDRGRRRRLEIDGLARPDRAAAASSPRRASRSCRRWTELGYVYNRGAANLRNAQSRIVGLVLNDLSNPFFAEFAIGVENGAADGGLCRLHGQHRRERGAAGAGDADDARAWRRRHHPVPGAGYAARASRLGQGGRIRRCWSRSAACPAPQASVVVPDNVAGASRITRHLINLGHERIAYLGGMHSMVVRQERYRRLLSMRWTRPAARSTRRSTSRACRRAMAASAR